MPKNAYNVIVLGGGPAGYHAAMRLADNQKNVLLIEEQKLGGTCLHEGCIPTKSFWNSVSMLQEIPDIPEIVRKKKNDVRKLYKGLQYQIQKRNIELVYGRGIIAEKNNDFFSVEVEGTKYCGKNVILATGSSAKRLSIKGLDMITEIGLAVYSNDFLMLEEFPERIVIIGSGVIGIEFASFLAKLKKKVYILEIQKKVLAELLDEDIRNILLQELSDLGIEIITGASIYDIDEHNIVYEKDGQFEELAADLVVVAGGRTGNIQNIGLELLGIRTDGEYILTDEHCETNVAGVYACGDVIGKSMLAHTAYREAEVAVDHICGINSEMCYDAIPSVIFCDPEIAATGFTELKCQENGKEYYVKKCSMNYSSKYLIEHGNQQGMCKMIFDTDHTLIGAQLVGNGSSELIFVLADMISQQQSEDSIRDKIYPHPSVVEVIKATVNMPRSNSLPRLV